MLQSSVLTLIVDIGHFRNHRRDVDKPVKARPHSRGLSQNQPAFPSTYCSGCLSLSKLNHQALEGDEGFVGACSFALGKTRAFHHGSSYHGLVKWVAGNCDERSTQEPHLKFYDSGRRAMGTCLNFDHSPASRVHLQVRC